MSEPINGNRRITLTLNDAIKGIVFVVTICGAGYAVQRRMDKMEDRIEVLTRVVTAQSSLIQTQQEDINEWKRATMDLVFKPGRREIAAR